MISIKNKQSTAAERHGKIMAILKLAQMFVISDDIHKMVKLTNAYLSTENVTVGVCGCLTRKLYLFNDGYIHMSTLEGK